MFLYHIFVLPLVYLFEILIQALSPVLELNPFIAIFIVSFIVNFLSYPIFKKIEEMCIKDNETWQKLLPKINSIKRNFKGAERRMLLQTYFRQNNYHPLFSHFKQSLTVFLQVPIFVASYIVICENPLFQSPLFEAINTFFVFGINIRALPIFMTIINVASVLVYMKNRPFSAKLYAYGLAFVFLVLLYFSPASIVVYWIFNNTFAFLRNIWFYRKNIFIPSLLAYLATVVGIAFYINFSYNTLYALMAFVLCFVAYKIAIYILKDAFLTSCVLLFCSIYLVMHYFGFILFKDSLFPFVYGLFIFEAAGLCYQEIAKKSKFMPSVTDCILPLLCAFVIFSIYLPLKIINSDPAEFYAVVDLKEVLSFEAQVGFGLFFMYPLMIFTLQKQRRKLIYYIIISFFVIGFIELSMFQRPIDVLCLTMRFERTDHFIYNTKSFLFDCVMFASVFLFTTVMMKCKLSKFIRIIFEALLLCYIIAVFHELHKTNASLKSFKENSLKAKYSYQLSTKSKNIVLIIADKAISGFIPFILKEKPELKDIFKGFTYFPYTVSFAAHTLYSTPSLLGGYEYTPKKLQSDTTRHMVDKHNESVSVLPELFRKAGYNVTLIDIPDINYGDLSKGNIYHNDINNIVIEGAVTERRPELRNVVQRNLFFFAIFRIAPKIMKDFVYDQGKYMRPSEFFDVIIKSESNLSNNYKIMEQFINAVKIVDNESGNFIVFHSMVPHSRSYMTKDYKVPQNNEDVYKENLFFTDSVAIKDYAVNMVTYLLLAQWIEYLKTNNVYDNTKIIVVSDHGAYFNVFENIEPKITPENAVLMVKDFNDTEPFKVSSDFMTVADIPYLSTKEAILNPENPFSAKPLSASDKLSGVDIVLNLFRKISYEQYEDKNRTYLYDEDVEYMHVDENNIKEMIKFEEIN